MQSETTIRTASHRELDVLAESFREMWLAIGWRPESFRDDWKDVVSAFVAGARAENEFAWFLAEADGAIVGTAACELLSGLHPEIRHPSAHRAGYIWGVYVRPGYRRQGIATKLTEAAIDHLRSCGCTQVKLHASKAGARVYRSMGFGETNELALALRNPSRAPG